MILLAVTNYLLGDPMVERFHADPAIQSVELLLQEQLPAAPPADTLAQTQVEAVRRAGIPAPSTQPWTVPVDSPLPAVHLLANGDFVSIVTNGGGGYLAWREVALTRWRADTTLDNWGTWVYLQDRTTGATWSVGRQPTGVAAEDEEIRYYPHMAEFRHRRGPLGVRMTVTVAPSQDVEVRRIDLTNAGDTPMHLRLTSYGEIVLGDGLADLRHQAFAKLFVESECLPGYNALVFRRRPRSGGEPVHQMAHALVRADGGRGVTYTSDRAAFLGRGRTSRRPAALDAGGELNGATGATLDPVMALGCDVDIPAHGEVSLALITTVAETRQQIEEMLGRYQSWSTVALAFSASRNQVDRLLHEQGLRATDVAMFDRLLSLLLYPHAQGRAAAAILAQNELSQSGLWPFGISGDYPILLVRVADTEQGGQLRRFVQAHAYWRRRGLLVDLVIVNEQETNYGQAVQGAIWRLLQRTNAVQALNQRGGIFLLRRDQMRPPEYTLLQTVARVVLDADQTDLTEQFADGAQAPSPLPDLIVSLSPQEAAAPMPPLPRPHDLHFDNGLGGFTADGRDYAIYLEPGVTTPAPWINVVANEHFGFIASESGGGYSWAENSGENRLTAWRNDPVTDMPAEALYLRDEETGEVWSPTPLPAPADAAYSVRHGAGYTEYAHHSHGLAQRVRLFIAPDAPVKYIQVRLRNHLARGRRLTVTFYAEWVLGGEHSVTTPFLTPDFHDADVPYLTVRNPYHAEFGSHHAFLATTKEIHGYTTDRTEFLGRNGDYARPAALRRVGLNDWTQPGRDICGALQVHIDLPPDGEEEFCFVLGQGENAEAAADLVQTYCRPDAAADAWTNTRRTWDELLGAVQVETPDCGMNLVLNRWLLYQALACRIWGRSALYQSSGAYGFRDQLQDVMALVHVRPDLVREQLLRAARHQFVEGDVLHWWHPPGARGVRTRISDDLLWLPYVTAHYVATTNDLDVLSETVPYLDGKVLGPGEEERYSVFQSGVTAGSLYDHCLAALRKGSTRGPHGLPLMGAGDWNDGMNRVGVEGRGESVWLGWFLYATLRAFADVAEVVKRPDDAQALRRQAQALRAALYQHAWDGGWYLRAFFDDGTPLGSVQNRECRIDAIAQSWAVLSEAGDPSRTVQAMTAVEDNLIRENDGLLLLFTPPFDKSRRDPGYIKGYVPGVRENGGQYTHAALWTIWAWAKLGDGDEALRLFQTINPIARADSAAAVQRYKVEPYVISADVYAAPPHVGRGGWTWYTGSAGWMYRLGVEGMLGLRRAGDEVWLDPCIAQDWPEFRLRLQHGDACYRFTVQNPHGVSRGVQSVTLDGRRQPNGRIRLKDDGQTHEVVVELGPDAGEEADTSA